MSKEQDSKLRKAAKILIALGEEGAASVLKHLNEHEMEKLMAEILQVGHIEKDERKVILNNFKEQLSDIEGTILGGRSEAEKLLRSAMGDQAGKFLEKLDGRVANLDFSFFEKYQPKTLARVLENELPQTVALILTNIKASLAASIMKFFEAPIAAKVAARIATLRSIDSQILKTIYESLRQRLENIDENEPDEESGEEKLSAILAHMNLADEEQILDDLRGDEPEMVERIKANLFNFEAIGDLTRAEIRKLFEHLPDETLWAAALKGMGRDFMRYVLSCVSMNRASDIVAEIDRLGALRLQDIEHHRNVIIQKAEELNRQGEIILRKHKEKLIE